MASNPSNGYNEVMSGTNNYTGSNFYGSSCPKTPVVPVSNDDLTNKLYVDTATGGGIIGLLTDKGSLITGNGTNAVIFDQNPYQTALTTTTVYDWNALAVAQSRTFTTTAPTLIPLGAGITITYSGTDSIKGNVTAVVGSTITITITALASAAYVPTAVYTSNPPAGIPAGALPPPSFNFTTDPTVSTPNPPIIPANTMITDGISFVQINATPTNFTVNLISDPALTTLGSSTPSPATPFPAPNNFQFADGAFVSTPTLFIIQIANLTQSVNFQYPIGGGFAPPDYCGQLNGYSLAYSTGSIVIDDDIALIADPISSTGLAWGVINAAAVGAVTSVSGGVNIVMSGTVPAPVVNLRNPLTAELNMGSQSLRDSASAVGTSGQLLTAGTGGQTLWTNAPSTNPTITDTNTNATFYPTFVAGAGVQPLLADIATGAISLNPSNGNFNVVDTLKLTQTQVAVGKSAGLTTQGASAVAVGNAAGNNTQGASSVAIGASAGQTTQGANAVAIGVNAASSGQLANAVAIGNAAGNNTQGAQAVAIGVNSALVGQGANSVAIGVDSGNTNQSANAVAVGIGAGQLAQGLRSVAVGRNAGNNTQSLDSVAVGNGAGQTTQGNSSVAVGLTAGQTNQGNGSVAVGGSAGQTTQGGGATAVGLAAGTTTQGASAVAIGSNAGNNNQGLRGVAIGLNAGNNTQSNDAVAIGHTAGQTTQGANSVAIGDAAGNNNQGASAVAIGDNAGETTQGTNSVAIGNSAGLTTQGNTSVAIGQNAGNFSQGSGAVAIGINAGAGVSGTNFQGANAVAIGNQAGQETQGSNSVAIGLTSGETTQGVRAVAIGFAAGQTTQGQVSVAIGSSAGNTSQGANNVAIGGNSGSASQGASSVAIGSGAGRYTQGTSCVAVGTNAGGGVLSTTFQGNGAVAIGTNAGQGTTTGQGANAIAIGLNAGVASQTAGSICLNATGAALNPNQAGFFVAPIRNLSTISPYNLQYDSTTDEVVSFLNNNNIIMEDFSMFDTTTNFYGNVLSFSETGTGAPTYYTGVYEAGILAGAQYRKGVIQMAAGTANPSSTILNSDLLFSYANISKVTFGIVPHSNETLAVVPVPAGNITQSFGIASTGASLGNQATNTVIWRMTSSGAAIPAWTFVINNVVQYTLTITPTNMTAKWCRAEINVNYGGGATATVSGTWYNLTDGTSETTGTYTITAGAGFPAALTTPNTVGIYMACYSNNATNKYLGVDYVEVQQPNLYPVGSGTTDTTGR